MKPIKRIPISKNTYSSKVRIKYKYTNIMFQNCVKHLFVQEIADFHDFCARNFGLTGGWSTKDHETFLKIRLRHDGVDFIDHVVHAMPRNINIFSIFTDFFEYYK